MMEAIGIVIKTIPARPWTPVVVYATKEGKFKYRTTEPVKKKVQGQETNDIHHSLTFASLEEAVGSAARFIKRTWNIDIESMLESQYSFETMNVAERMVSKISPKVASKLRGFLSSMGGQAPEASVPEEHVQTEVVEEESEVSDDIL